MTNYQAIGSTLATFVVAVCVACSNSSGRPAPDSVVVPPDEIVNFSVLYRQNCAGCHGVDGKGGAAIALANPVFLAIADDTVIRRIASNGVPGTPMPAFAQSAGGMLTDKQIDAIVRGIRSWAKPDALGNQTPPPYAAPGSRRSATRRRCVSNVLFLLSWSRRPRRKQGQLDCGWLVPRSGK